SQRTCELDECDKPHRAGGLCASHDNQTYAPDRHRTDKVCEASGAKDTATRTDGRHCSLASRDDARTGRTAAEREAEKREHEARVAEWRARPRKAKPTPFAPEGRECAWCGRGYVAARADSMYCGPGCKRRAKGVRRR